MFKRKASTPVIRYDLDGGLTREHVKLRKQQKLVNSKDVKTSKSYAAILLKNIFTLFNILWFIIAAILIYIGAYEDCFFLIIIVSNLLIGIIQEIKAKITVEKLSLLTAPEARVIREGEELNIPAADVVLDDIIKLCAGNEICCDSVVKEGSIEVNEALLTGESVPVKKNAGDSLFAGSFVTAGNCIARADKVGAENYIQKLAKKAKSLKDTKSQLLKSLKFIINVIAVLLIPLTALVIYKNHLTLTDTYELITRSSGAVIGMIPAGMFLLTSMALAVGILRLSKKRTLVHDLYSIEMLARTTTLCLDKTGTITDGTMAVKESIALTEHEKTAGDIVSSILHATKDNNHTALALIAEYGNQGVFNHKIALPFSSSRKLSAATFFDEGTYIMGSAEFIFPDMSEELKQLIYEKSSQGYRVIGVGHSPEEIEEDNIPRNIKPLYIILLEDHIRENAPQTIKWFEERGVKIKIISGDNPVSVSQIAKKVGIKGAENYISVENMSDEDLVKQINNNTVFGRVSPDQKAVIINALKASGETVGMTGDGVNDILAMKEADCSIAMAAGSEATRNVSNLVLLDSDFSRMPDVVSEGRRVINNITKTSSIYLMKTFFVMMLIVAIALLPAAKYNFAYPFTPKQMMPLEIFVIGLPSFFLALQPNNNKIANKFLSTVFKNAMPASIVLLFNILAVNILGNILEGISSENIDTMAIYCTTFAGFIMLAILCYKFNLYRAVMFFIMLGAAVLSLALMPDFYELGKLNLTEILTVVGLLVINFPMLLLLIKLAKKVIVQ